MRVLGIESSCDESACALLELRPGSRPLIISERISSQVELHERYGGVVPELASRAHLGALPLVLGEVLEDSGCELSDVELIAVTRGPGLKGCLLVGLNFALGLGVARGLPVVGVNHIEGHLLAPFLDDPELAFPYLALVVSGGHTELVEVRGIGQYVVRARTIDDAAGEAFDKSAALLGLGYPGGPRLAELADRNPRSPYRLPRVMREAEGFSFSGFKTAVARLVSEELSKATDREATVQALCAAVQEGIVDSLVWKVKDALSKGPFSRVVVTGGVSANRSLQIALRGIPGVTVHAPAPRHCTDNAAMIAYVGAERYRRGERERGALPPMARWPVERMNFGEGSP